MIMQQWAKHIPAVINSLDNETKCWTDSIDVFAHDLLNYCSLSSIVQTAEPR
jgi:hypothetical protein